MDNQHISKHNKPDYSAFASGQVFYSHPGFTAFPAELASDIFSKSVSFLEGLGNHKPYTLYDPCCGSGQLLTTIGLLYGEYLSCIAGSDINPDAVDLTDKNLHLLTKDGIEKRIEELQDLVRQFGKESHKQSLQYAHSFRDRVGKLHTLEVITFQADATNPQSVKAGIKEKVQLVITDVPYGRESQWRTTSASEEEPAKQLLDALLPALAEKAVVAVAVNRQQKIEHPAYIKLGQLKAAKRRVIFLTQKTA